MIRANGIIIYIAGLVVPLGVTKITIKILELRARWHGIERNETLGHLRPAQRIDGILIATDRVNSANRRN